MAAILDISNGAKALRIMQLIIKYLVIPTKAPIIWNWDCQVRTSCKRYSNHRNITAVDCPRSTIEYNKGMETYELYQLHKAHF